MFLYEIEPGLALKPLELGDVEDVFTLIAWAFAIVFGVC